MTMRYVKDISMNSIPLNCSTITSRQTLAGSGLLTVKASCSHSVGCTTLSRTPLDN